MSSDPLTDLTRGAWCVVEACSDWIKVAKVRKGVIELAAAAPFDGLKGDGSEVLRALVKEHGLAGLPAIALVPRQAVNIRMLELPSQDAAEVRDMIDLQATKQTPYTREEVLFDYSALAADRPGYTRAVLAIVQRSVLRHRYYLLEEAGLRLVRMSVSSEALLNWTRLSEPSGSGYVAVLDMDSRSAEVAIVGPAGLMFSRAIQAGAADLAGGQPGAADRLVDEVKRGIDIVRGEARDIAIGKLVVTGAVSAGDGIVGRLSEVLGIPCVHRRSFSVAEGAAVGEAAAGRCSMTAVAGAASAPAQLSFNLIPESVLARRTVLVRGRQMAALAALVLTCLTLASLFGMTRYASARERLNGLEKTIAAGKPAADRTERRREVIETVRRRQGGQAAPLELLLDVVHLVPQGISLDSIDLNRTQGQVTLTGTAPSMRDIRGLVAGLEQSAWFRDVHEGNATTLDKTQRYRFQLVANMEKTK